MTMKLVVRRRRAERFVIVPADVVAMLSTAKLTANAFAALCVLMSKPDGWRWSAAEIMAASGLGKDAWQAARRVLEAVGAITPGRPRVEGGRFAGSAFEVDWPALGDGDGDRERGNPAAGETAEKSPVSSSPGADKPGSTEPGLSAASLEEKRQDAPPLPRRSGASCRAALETPVLVEEGEAEQVEAEQVEAEQVEADPHAAAKARVLDLACDAFPEMRHKWAHARRALEGAVKGSAPVSAAGQGGSTWPGGEAGQVVA